MKVHEEAGRQPKVHFRKIVCFEIRSLPGLVFVNYARPRLADQPDPEPRASWHWDYKYAAKQIICVCTLGIEFRSSCL